MPDPCKQITDHFQNHRLEAFFSLCSDGVQSPGVDGLLDNVCLWE